MYNLAQTLPLTLKFLWYRWQIQVTVGAAAAAAMQHVYGNMSLNLINLLHIIHLEQCHLNDHCKKFPMCFIHLYFEAAGMAPKGLRAHLKLICQKFNFNLLRL